MWINWLYKNVSAYTSRLRRLNRCNPHLQHSARQFRIFWRNLPLICSGVWTARGARARGLGRRCLNLRWPPEGIRISHARFSADPLKTVVVHKEQRTGKQSHRQIFSVLYIYEMWFSYDCVVVTAICIRPWA